MQGISPTRHNPPALEPGHVGDSDGSCGQLAIIRQDDVMNLGWGSLRECSK